MLGSIVNILWGFLVTPFHVSLDHWKVIAAAFVTCQLVYIYGHKLCMRIPGYRKLSIEDQVEWQTRVTSTIHGLLVFPIVLYVAITDDALYANPVYGRNPYSSFAFCLGIGYFFSDLVQVLRYKIKPMAPIIAHHVFAGWGFLLCVSDIGAASWYGTYLLLTEATAPFNNTHWKLTKLELDHTPLCKVIGYCFAATWLVFRVLNNPLLVYKLYAHWDELLTIPAYLQLLLTLNVVFLMSLNNYWFFFGPFYEMVFGSPAQKQKELQRKQNSPTLENKKAA